MEGMFMRVGTVRSTYKKIAHKSVKSANKWSYLFLVPVLAFSSVSNGK